MKLNRCVRGIQYQDLYQVSNSPVGSSITLELLLPSRVPQWAREKIHFVYEQRTRIVLCFRYPVIYVCRDKRIKHTSVWCMNIFNVHKWCAHWALTIKTASAISTLLNSATSLIAVLAIRRPLVIRIVIFQITKPWVTWKTKSNKKGIVDRFVALKNIYYQRPFLYSLNPIFFVQNS